MAKIAEQPMASGHGLAIPCQACGNQPEDYFVWLSSCGPDAIGVHRELHHSHYLCNACRETVWHLAIEGECQGDIHAAYAMRVLADGDE